MPMYMIGDLQGCYQALLRLLDKVDFSPSRDTLYLLGDLVNRGPESLQVLRYLAQLGDSAQCLLGNHDLQLLAMWQGAHQPQRRQTSQAVLEAPDAHALLDWLRHRHMALYAQGWLMVHAGVLPTWTVAQTLTLAAEVEAALRGQAFAAFIQTMYGNTPARWHDKLEGAERLRVIVNALTRLRFCTPEGTMEFESRGRIESAPAGYLPWFEAPARATQGTPIAFGHWSALGADRAAAAQAASRHHTLALDSGCVWGGCLTAAKLYAGADSQSFELISVACHEDRPAV